MLVGVTNFMGIWGCFRKSQCLFVDELQANLAISSPFFKPSAALRMWQFAAILAAQMTQPWPSMRGQRGESRLWLMAFGWSLLVNLGLLLVLGLGLLESHLPGKRSEVMRSVVAEPVLTIVPEIAVPEVRKKPAKPRFARTSDEQESADSVKDAPFIGERSTRATSDRAPTPTAPAQASQKGIRPRDESEIETTESRYQDGKMSEPRKSRESPREVQASAQAAAAPDEKKAVNPSDKVTSSRSGLVQGPNPVDVAVSPEQAQSPRMADASEPKPLTEEKAKVVSPRPPEPKKEKEFRGNQRKTAMVGSISRTGPSALDVADTPLGRYQATISRAVEIEWQRNCVRHRDFITPGFLTVRFFVETSGKVKSVQFVGDMETGEVQKGFTLNAIRKAAIPPMPQALRKEYDDEPLELMFRFYF
ncbi:MAG: hypothetical protein RLY69_415 [Verrucomicrobiota bacterium]